MKNSWIKRMALVATIGAFASKMALAEVSLPPPELDSLPLLAMSLDEGKTNKKNSIAAEQALFKEPLFTQDKAHQYLGIGALGLLALAVVSPKEEDGPHEYFATGSAFLASAAVTSGLIFHWEDFDLSEGFSDPDNLHVLLAGLGTLAMIAAVSQAPEGGHAGLGATGGVLMVSAVKITW